MTKIMLPFFKIQILVLLVLRKLEIEVWLIFRVLVYPITGLEKSLHYGPLIYRIIFNHSNVFRNWSLVGQSPSVHIACKKLRNLVPLIEDWLKLHQGLFSFSDCQNDQANCQVCKREAKNLWLCLFPGCWTLGCSDDEAGSPDCSTRHHDKNPSHVVQLNVRTKKVWCYACTR